MPHGVTFKMPENKQVRLIMRAEDAPHVGDWVVINGFRGVVKEREWQIGDVRPIEDSSYSEHDHEELIIKLGR
jgi:hypothetical protein